MSKQLRGENITEAKGKGCGKNKTFSAGILGESEYTGTRDLINNQLPVISQEQVE